MNAAQVGNETESENVEPSNWKRLTNGSQTQHGEIDMTSNNNRNQWVDDLVRESGGWGGAGIGAAITIFGAFKGFALYMIVGPIFILIAALLAIVGWFRNR